MTFLNKNKSFGKPRKEIINNWKKIIYLKVFNASIENKLVKTKQNSPDMYHSRHATPHSSCAPNLSSRPHLSNYCNTAAERVQRLSSQFLIPLRNCDWLWLRCCTRNRWSNWKSLNLVYDDVMTKIFGTTDMIQDGCRIFNCWMCCSEAVVCSNTTLFALCIPAKSCWSVTLILFAECSKRMRLDAKSILYVEYARSCFLTIILTATDSNFIGFYKVSATFTANHLTIQSWILEST